MKLLRSKVGPRIHNFVSKCIFYISGQLKICFKNIFESSSSGNISQNVSVLPKPIVLINYLIFQGFKMILTSKCSKTLKERLDGTKFTRSLIVGPCQLPIFSILCFYNVFSLYLYNKNYSNFKLGTSHLFPGP